MDTTSLIAAAAGYYLGGPVGAALGFGASSLLSKPGAGIAQQQQVSGFGYMKNGRPQYLRSSYGVPGSLSPVSVQGSAGRSIILGPNGPATVDTSAYAPRNSFPPRGVTGADPNTGAPPMVRGGFPAISFTKSGDPVPASLPVATISPITGRNGTPNVSVAPNGTGGTVSSGGGGGGGVYIDPSAGMDTPPSLPGDVPGTLAKATGLDPKIIMGGLAVAFFLSRR